MTESKMKKQAAEAQNEELKRLRAENEELLRKAEAGNIGGDPSLATYMQEMDVIRKTARVESDKIKVHEFSDHKNISLWAKDGKRIGPLHQSNALKTFQTFWTLGIRLSTKRPTPEQIAAYQESPEGKAAKDALKKKRAIKEKSRKSGQIEKLAAEIAKMSGTTVEAINSILRANDIKSLAEGRAQAGL